MVAGQEAAGRQQEEEARVQWEKILSVACTQPALPLEGAVVQVTYLDTTNFCLKVH